ncbi:MAG: hypothetical protein WCJ35_04460 [Planctomycetota bacterium]
MLQRFVRNDDIEGAWGRPIVDVATDKPHGISHTMTLRVEFRFRNTPWHNVNSRDVLTPGLRQSDGDVSRTAPDVEIAKAGVKRKSTIESVDESLKASFRNADSEFCLLVLLVQLRFRGQVPLVSERTQD